MYIEYVCAFLMITMNDVDEIFTSSIPVSPVYINALVLFNGKSLPTFVNHTIMKVESTAECSLLFGAFSNTFDLHKSIIALENHFCF